MTSTKAAAVADQATPDDQTSIEAPLHPKPKVVTLEELALETKVSPRDARMLLRLASKQTKQYPTLGRDHVPRQPWQWPVGSKALEEARKALLQSE